MKRFLKYIMLFGSFCILSLLIGEITIRMRPNQYKFKKEWMDQNASSVDILILGHSQAYYGIIPSMFPGVAFSLANVSQTFKYDYLLLSEYAAQCPRLSTVIIPVTYSSFFDKDMDEGDEWGYASNYKMYMGINLHSGLSKFNFEISNFPVYAGKLRSIFTGGNLAWDDGGHGEDFGYSNRASDLESSAVSAAKRHTASDWKSVNDNVMWLERIIGLCSKRHVRLILVTPPVSQAYRNRLDSRQLSAMHDIINGLVTRHGLSYYDYSAARGFGEGDFYDADHLSSDKGAAKFTSLLIRDVFRCDTIAPRP